MMVAKSLVYQFLDVRVEVAPFRVMRGGRALALEPKAIETLIFLLERPGRLVEKDELLNGVWRDSFVTPNALTRIIAQLRRELGDDPKAAQIIETVPTRGYRFIAEVEQWQEADSASSASFDSKAIQFTGDGFEANPLTTFDVARTQEEFSQAEFDPEQREEGAFGVIRNQPPPEISTRNRKVSRILWFAAAGVLGLATLAAIIYQRHAVESQKLPLAHAPQSIAVLPFKQLASAGGDENIGLGLADALITKLSGLRQILVRPTSAIFKYGQSEEDVAEIGRKLKVSTVLDGSVQRSGERVHVTVRLLRVADGMPIWAESYDTEFNDVFQVQEAISTKIASALSLQLNEDERQRLAKRPTEDIEAYQLYLRGVYHLGRFTVEDHNQAVSLFNQAIARDPSFALAYANLGNVYQFGMISTVKDQNQAKAKAVAAFQKALSLDPALPELHAAMAAIEFWGFHNARAARESFTRAMVFNPNSTLAYQQYAWFLVATGNFKEAKEIQRRAFEIDPLTPADQSMPFYYERDYETARAIAERESASDPHNWLGPMRLGNVYEGLGDYARAVANFERALALQAPSDIRAHLARALAGAGKTEEARRMLNEIISSKGPQLPSPYFIALAYVALGEKETAFKWLDRARAENDKWLGWLKVDPCLDPIRRDARFAVLTKALDVDHWN